MPMAPADDQPSIFVSIASYRDSQCQYTIRDLFQKARHPSRVIVGVCHQVAESDSDCFLLNLDPWANQIRTYFLPHAEAKGPCYARSLIQQELLRDEDFYFQVDSHFRFAPAWDELLLEQLAACGSPRAVLTTLASAYELPRGHRPGVPDDAVLSRREAMMVLCADKFGDQCPGQDDAFLRIKNRVCRTHFGHWPPPALFWTARFHFSRAEAVRECPYDPFLDYIFFGEEISMAARLYTHGWDLFNPTKTIGYHLQSRFHRPFYTEVQVSELSVRRHRYAKGRLYKLLGDERHAAGEGASAPSQPYGLGSARTLADYERYCGVSFRDHAVSDHGLRGGVAPEHLAPLWAEEARNELLSAKCFADPEVWAGKGNAEALSRQFPDALVKKGPPVELLCAHSAAKSKVEDLAAARGAQGVDVSPEMSLECGRACAHLGQLSQQLERSQEAQQACLAALRHVEAAAAAAPAAWAASASWRCSLDQVGACALGGLRRFAEGKVAITKALGAAVEALQTEGGEAAEALALDVVSLLHQLYEQTDDKAGLAEQVGGLDALLGSLRPTCPGAAETTPGRSQPLLRSDRPPEEQQETVRARLLEAVLLLLMVPGTEHGDSAARRVFVDFKEEVRGSARLQRQLGMLQAGGMFLDVGP